MTMENRGVESSSSESMNLSPSAVGTTTETSPPPHSDARIRGLVQLET